MLVIWEADLGWSRVDLTGAIALAILTSALCSPAAGKLIDKGMGPQVMAGCTILGAISLFLLSWVDKLLTFYLLWAVIGMSFSGCLYDPCFALLTRSRGARAKQGITVITLIAGFAGTMSFPGAYYIADAVGWRNTIQIFAVVVMLIATPLIWIGADAIEKNRILVYPNQKKSDEFHFTHFLSPAFLCLGIGFSLVAVVHGVTLQHLIPILQERQIHEDLVILIASLIGPVQVVGRLILMFTQPLISNHTVSMSCFIIMTFSIMALLSISLLPGLLVIFVILFGCGYGVSSIIRPVIARDILGNSNFGIKFGVLSLLYLIGAAAAPFLGSLVWNVGGYNLVLFCLIILAITGLILYTASHRMSKG